jgi:hypothetical protein
MIKGADFADPGKLHLDAPGYFLVLSDKPWANASPIFIVN